jgi:hypothetical protein
MDTGITSEKSTFVQSNGIEGLIEALKETLSELALTPYNDVVITDYMSKWANLDPSTLKIVDNTTGEIIWTAAEGWLIAEELRPTAQEVPVVVELVDRAGYAAGGPDVAGNTSGDIYKLTWYVKDGALLRSDNYKLVYEVEVDTAEYGFKYGKDYPANGFTDLHYIDVNGDKQTNEIKVPNIISITGTVTLKKVDENGKLISGAVFELYKIENGTEALIGTYKLDNGKIAINNLAVGSYKLVETKAPKGYIGIDEPMYFEIIRNKAGKLEVKIAYELEFPATAFEISNNITSIAPTNAATNTNQRPISKTSPIEKLPPQTNIATATPKLAPALTPNNDESASGLENNVCITSPATASPPPESNATTASGKRECSTIKATSSAEDCPISSATTSATGISTLPTKRFVTNRSNIKTIKQIILEEVENKHFR